MTQNHVKTDETCTLWRWHLVTHGQPRVHKPLEKYIVVHTYVHIYIKGWHKRTSTCTQSLRCWHHFHVQDGLLIVFQASSIYLLHKVVCFVLFATLRYPKLWCIHALGVFRKLSMSKGALTWFETVWSYSVEAIDY
jgi:hypothetical protein